MIERDFKEKKQGYAEIAELDASTFDRFLEWVYKGYYTAPKAKSSSTDAGQDLKETKPRSIFDPPAEDFEDEAQRIDEGEGQRIDYDWGGLDIDRPVDGSHDSWGASKALYKSKKGKKTSSTPAPTSKAVLMESFRARKPVIRETSISIPSPSQNHVPSDNYEAVFLCHAQLYVFAERFLIDKLRILALDELHASLASFHLFTERTGDIVSLLRYAYAETSTRSAEEGLLSLLADYVALEMDTLIKDAGFGELLVENANDHGGTLLADFLRMVSKRL